MRRAGSIVTSPRSGECGIRGHEGVRAVRGAPTTAVFRFSAAPGISRHAGRLSPVVEATCRDHGTRTT
ncbi:hypothetical protein SPW_5775 [Streptomyces sp. W007]|nr:hypothetical protein SPW_5775 [Streptomyces sp. W007]